MADYEPGKIPGKVNKVGESAKEKKEDHDRIDSLIDAGSSASVK